jgi:hypothetical protein
VTSYGPTREPMAITSSSRMPRRKRLRRDYRPLRGFQLRITVMGRVASSAMVFIRNR